MEKLKPIPKFNSEKEWANFWMTHDSTEFVDWSKAKRTVFPNLKPASKSISLRLPLPTLNKIKMLANKKDIPYQSLMKVYLSEKIEEELMTNSIHR